MKKCPECGNPSYDGAPVCGNCGYKFPVRKPAAPKREAEIFKKDKKVKKTKKAKQPKKPKQPKKSKEPKSLKKAENPQNESTLEIIKENKIVIGIIIAVTIIAICGIVLSGSNHTNNTTSGTTNVDSTRFSEAGFSFSIPNNWNKINGKDSSHNTAVFFDAGNDTVVEFYNITSDYTSLKEINQDRITKAQSEGEYIDTVETLTIDERNASNMIVENADGDYTRYVSIFTDGKLYVFKITGNSLNNVNSETITNAILSAHIEQ